MAAQRDPISVWFDPAAVRLLTRAYKNRGEWTGVYVGRPSIRQRAAAASLGIWDLSERDRWGEVRWIRAFKRACYWQVKHYGYEDGLRPGDRRTSPYPAVALTWETGRLVRLAGWPTSRWAVRVAVHDRAGPGYRAAISRAQSDGTYWPGTGQQSTLADRDYEQVGEGTAPS